MLRESSIYPEQQMPLVPPMNASEDYETGWEIIDPELIKQDFAKIADSVEEEELKLVIQEVSHDTEVIEHLRQIRARHPETYDHCLRVGRGVLEFSAEPHNDLSQTATRDIFVAALLHDVGKCNIPHELLNKRGITSTEKRAIEKHVPKGYRQLDGDKFTTVRRIVGAHHWWKPDNYGVNPNNIADDNSESVVSLSQILALADVYDALVNPRYYIQDKPLLNQEQIFAIMDKEFQGNPTLLKEYKHYAITHQPYHGHYAIE